MPRGPVKLTYKINYHKHQGKKTDQRINICVPRNDIPYPLRDILHLKDVSECPSQVKTTLIEKVYVLNQVGQAHSSSWGPFKSLTLGSYMK